MRKPSLWIAAFIVIGIAIYFIATRRAERDSPLSCSVVDVPRMAFRGNMHGQRLLVVLRFPLRFSEDRTVGYYSPSVEGDSSKTVEFHFREPIHYSPDVVLGTVSRFQFDTLRRPNRLPGFAVISDCVPD